MGKSANRNSLAKDWSNRYHPAIMPAMFAWRVLMGVVSIIWRLMGWLYSLYRRRQSREVHRANQQRIKQSLTSGRLGQSRLGDASDAEELGLFRDPGQEGGLYLGCKDGRPCFWEGSQHLNIIAPTDTGKTYTYVVQNCIGLALDGQSIAVLDLKEEIHESCKRGLEEILGEPPVKIEPFAGNSDVWMNALYDVVEDAQRGNPIKDTVLSKMSLFFSQERLNSKNGWLVAKAKDAVDVVTMYLAEDRPEACHLAELAGLASMTQSAFVLIMKKVAASNAGGGYAAEIAEGFVETYSSKDEYFRKEFSWIKDEIKIAFGLFSKGSMLHDFVMPRIDRDGVIHHGFDPAIMNKRPMALFLVYPPRFVESHSGFAAVLMDYIIRRAAYTEGPVRVNMVLDEIANYNPLKSIRTALTLLRGYGVRILAFSQSQKQLEDRYKELGGLDVFESQSINIMWAMRDMDHAAKLEARSGFHSEIVPSYSTSMSVGMDQGTVTGSEQKVPNLSRYEISTINEGEAIVVMSGKRVMIVERPFYFQSEWCAPYVDDIRESENWGGFLS